MGVGVTTVKPPGPDGEDVAIPGGVGVEIWRITGVNVGGTRVDVGGTRLGAGMGVSVGVSRTDTGVFVEVGGTTTGVDVGGTGVDVGGTRVGIGMGVSVGVTRPVEGVSVEVGTTMTIAGVSVEVGAMIMIAGVSVGGATCPFGAATAGSTAFARSTPTRMTATKITALAAALSTFLARIGLRATIMPLRMRGVNSAIDSL